MAFPSTQMWQLEVIVTPIGGYQARRCELRNADPRSTAAALRTMADQIERECQIQFESIAEPSTVPLMQIV